MRAGREERRRRASDPRFFARDLIIVQKRKSSHLDQQLQVNVVRLGRRAVLGLVAPSGNEVDTLLLVEWSGGRKKRDFGEPSSSSIEGKEKKVTRRMRESSLLRARFFRMCIRCQPGRRLGPDFRRTGELERHKWENKSKRKESRRRPEAAAAGRRLMP